MCTIFTVVHDTLSPNLSNHLRYPHNISITTENQCDMSLLELNNLVMKRLVGGGDDWCIHMDVMIMVLATILTICWVLKIMSGQKDYD